MSARHPVVDLSGYIPVRPYPAVLGTPEPTMPVEVPTTTFETEEIPPVAWILGGIGLLGGGALGWQLCNIIVSTEWYQNFAKEILTSIIPIRKIQLLAGISHVVIEVAASLLGIEVPPED